MIDRRFPYVILNAFGVLKFKRMSETILAVRNNAYPMPTQRLPIATQRPPSAAALRRARQ